MTLEELLAKQEIYELCCTYMRSLDRLDGQLRQSVFHDDATVDYGFFKGSGRDFVDFAQRALESHLANHHMIGQVHIDLQGDTAYGEVYFQAFHRIVEKSQEKDLFISGRYLDRYEKRDGVWKIAFRSEINDWSRTDPATDEFLKNAKDALIGGRMPEDLSYHRDKWGSDLPGT